MVIGLTYDLREDYLALGYTPEEVAEFDRLETIEALEKALRELGHRPVRIGNARSLIRALGEDEHWDLVFNICEGLKGRAREAQVPCILDAFDIPYTFSDAFVLAVCLDKALTKTLIKQAGLLTPAFQVIKREEDLAKLNLPWPLFAKPLAEGTGKGITASSKISKANEFAAKVSYLLKRYQQPVLLETFLPGREFTVGIVGTGQKARVLGTLEIILKEQAEAEVYSYQNKEECERLVEYRLVKDSQARAAEELALAAWQVLDCRDAGRIDIRLDCEGRPNFLEVNPLAGLHPHHSDLPILCSRQGLSYTELIGLILASASERLKQEC